ncbi:MAG: hypothetical protein AAFV07_11400, partial [Bacteroidota bacterium]
MARPSLLIETSHGLVVNQDTASAITLKVQAFATGECVVKIKLPEAAESFEFLPPTVEETDAGEADIAEASPVDEGDV